MVDKIKAILPNATIEKRDEDIFVVFGSSQLTWEQYDQFYKSGLRVQEALLNFEGANILYKPCYIISDKSMPEVK